jgi:hypothetical protein
MQETFRVDGDLSSDLLDRGGLQFVPDLGGSAEDRLVRQQLHEAREFAGNGDFRSARVLCAEIMFEHQLRLARDRDLLRSTIATLIHARGFQLLSRLLVAVDGRRVRVALGEPHAGSATPPKFIERSEDCGATTFTVSERLYGDPSCNAVVDRWSEELAMP